MMQKKGGGNVRFLLEQKHLQNPETKDRSWWTRKLAEHRKYYGNLQDTRWVAMPVQVEGYYAQVTKGMSDDRKKIWSRTRAGQVWNRLRGVNPEVGDVATGVKAIGLVSIVWWEKLLEEFNTIEEHLYPEEPKEKEALAAYEAWKSAINLISHRIIPELKNELEKNIDPADGSEPKWWYRIFEAINSQNYTSSEWWAQDWAYHKGWGPSVFKEINGTYYEGKDVLNVENYLDDASPFKGASVLKEIAEFYKKHYTLHIRDVYQTDLMHAFLPIDPSTGEFYFNYKTVQYRGIGGDGYRPYWEGLEVIARDVRNAPDDQSLIRTIYEAKTVVNGWYADTTTEAKAIHVATAFQNIGVRKIAEANGINRLITGHIPMHDYQKLPEDRRRIITGHLISTEDKMHTFADSDSGMGKNFGGGAKYIAQGRNGFWLRGYPSNRFPHIVDNPETIIFKSNGSGGDIEKRIYRNDDPIPSESFLKSVVESIQTVLKDNAMTAKVRLDSRTWQTFVETALQADDNRMPAVLKENREALIHSKTFNTFLSIMIKISKSMEQSESIRSKVAAYLKGGRPLLWRDVPVFLSDILAHQGDQRIGFKFRDLLRRTSTDRDVLKVFLVDVNSAALQAVLTPKPKVKLLDAAMNGGIDLNASKLNLQKSGSGIEIKFDPAMVARFRQGNFDGITPVIISITPIMNIDPVLGLKEPEETEKLASV